LIDCYNTYQCIEVQKQLRMNSFLTGEVKDHRYLLIRITSSVVTFLWCLVLLYPLTMP